MWAQFTLDKLDNILCSSLTRFTRTELDRFLSLLGFEEIQFRNRVQATPEKVLAVVLIKLSFPNCYWEMMDRFGYSRTWLLIVFNDTMIHLYWPYRKKLVWDKNRLTYKQLSIYAITIYQFGGRSCFWGFIDGTFNATCQPVIDQEQFYSRHKQKHGYKFQLVVTPDGLVSSLIRPFIGQRGDWKMVEDLGIVEKLKEVNGGRRPAHALYWYSDPAYCTVYGIIKPYKNYPLRSQIAAQNKFNKAMSQLQIKIEHGFAIHQNL